MKSPSAFFRWTELDRTNFPAWRDRILEAETAGIPSEPRSYPGYPRRPLQRMRPRLWPALDRVLGRRRWGRKLGTALPARPVLSRLLQFSHGINAPENRGPIPSAGGLQALELYLVIFESSWVPGGIYHYDRSGHFLAQLAEAAGREEWRTRVPSLIQIEGGALLWMVVGDGKRMETKYGERGYRFLLLEAGHLMQNLCLVSASLGLSTVPLGGYWEREIGRELTLPPGDEVLYLGVCGKLQ